MKTPTTKEAVVVQNSSPRSVVVQTDRGQQCRNRHHLRPRSEKQMQTQTSPRASSALPRQNLEPRRTSEEQPTDQVPTSTVQPAAMPDTQPDNPPVEETCQKTCYTKSGRKVQAPQRLDL